MSIVSWTSLSAAPAPAAQCSSSPLGTSSPRGANEPSSSAPRSRCTSACSFATCRSCITCAKRIGAVQFASTNSPRTW
eukprot:251741-Pleurochrysis_carterae.AAC.1